MTYLLNLLLMPLLPRSHLLAKLLQLAMRHGCLSLGAFQASRLLPHNLGELHSKRAQCQRIAASVILTRRREGKQGGWTRQYNHCLQKGSMGTGS